MNNFRSGEIFVKIVDVVVHNEERLVRVCRGVQIKRFHWHDAESLSNFLKLACEFSANTTFASWNFLLNGISANLLCDEALKVMSCVAVAPNRTPCWSRSNISALRLWLLVSAIKTFRDSVFLPFVFKSFRILFVIHAFRHIT